MNCFKVTTLCFTVVALLLFSVAASTQEGNKAQDKIIKDFSAPQVDQFIKDVIKGDPQRKMVDAKGAVIMYSTPEGEFDVYLRTAPKKAIFFVYAYKEGKNTPQTIHAWSNAWNNGLEKHTRLGTIKTKEGESVLLIGSLNLEAGLSFGQLASFYKTIQLERQLFEKLMK
jgi:hypothetical protein